MADGGDASIDGGLIADVVAAEEGGEGLGSGALDELEGRPALDEVGEDGSLLVAEPVENLREVGLQGGGDAIGDADAILDQGATSLDEAPERAHGDALGLEAGELVGVSEQELQSELGVGGVVLGAAGGERRAVASEGLGLDGEEDEEVVLEQGRNDRTLAELDADGDRERRRTGAELVGPSRMAAGVCGTTERSRLVEPATQRQTSCFLSAQSMPTKAANGTGFCMGQSSCTDGGAGHAEPDPAKAIRRAGGAAVPEYSLRATAHPPARN